MTGVKPREYDLRTDGLGIHDPLRLEAKIRSETYGIKVVSSAGTPGRAGSGHRATADRSFPRRVKQSENQSGKQIGSATVVSKHPKPEGQSRSSKQRS